MKSETTPVANSWPPRGNARLGILGRDECGLTTLEWLLIVAAVAGLAALAVVLVQNVVDETAEEISGTSARDTAAKVAAARIETDAVEAIVDLRGATASNAVVGIAGVNAEFGSKCRRLGITYSDTEIDADWMDFSPAITNGTDEAALRMALSTAVNNGAGCDTGLS